MLLYKDARCDQNILDETFGAFGWQKEYTRENRNCIVKIWDKDKGQWISKEDTGTESFTEKEKGLASDSFKRACFCWGIGRALYTAPFIKITADKCEIKIQKNGKPACYDNFVVSGIDYNENGNICYLTIKNMRTGKQCFSWGKRGENVTEKDIAPDNEPDEPVPQFNKNTPGTVTTAPKIPDKEQNPVKKYVANEITFMKQLLGTDDTTVVMNKFKEMRQSLINAKIIEDVDSDTQTMEQAKYMIEAMYSNFFSDKKETA